MIGFSVLMLILGFLGLITGIVLIVIKKTRKAGIFTTIASVACGLIFSIVFVVGIINEGVEAIDDSTSKSNTSDTSSDVSSGESVDINDEISLDEETKDSNEETTSEEGTRATPMPLNSTLSLTGTMMDSDTYDNFDASIDITVVETIRGEKAAQMIQSENQFNDPAPEGKEYILNKVKVRAYDIASPENKFMIDGMMEFEYVSESGTLYSGEAVVIPNELSATLYNDGTAEGYIQGTVDKNDANPLIKYEKFYFSTK